MGAVASLLESRVRIARLPLSQTALIAVAWLATRLFLAKELGWFGGPKNYQDIVRYQDWASFMAHTHHLPTGSAWQYPVGAAWLFLLAHLENSHYGGFFCLMMFACDLGVTALLTIMAKRQGQYRGVWLWLALVLVLGPLAIMRFDLLPTLLIVAALTALWFDRRVGWFGTLLGAGAMVKVWPVLGLLAATSRRELLKALGWLVATALVITGLSSIYFGNTLGFISNQSTRGMEVEAIAATPAWVHMGLTGRPIDFWVGSGAVELKSATATSVASDLRILMLVLGLALLVWWAMQTRRRQTLSPAVAVDAVFVVVLGYIVISPVLSPQYLIWLMGVSAFALCTGKTAMTRPIMAFAASVVVTRLVYENLIYLNADKWVNFGGTGIVSPSRTEAVLMVVRNVLLLGAAVDAVSIMCRRSSEHPREVNTHKLFVGSG